MLQSRQVKCTPQDSINELIIWKNESLSHSRNQHEIQIGIPACVMSSEYFTRTSLYLVRFEDLWVDKIALKTLTSIQGNWAGRNVITALVWIHSSLCMQECRDESEIYNYQQIQLMNNSLMESWGVRLTWLDCNKDVINNTTTCKCSFYCCFVAC